MSGRNGLRDPKSRLVISIRHDRRFRIIPVTAAEEDAAREESGSLECRLFVPVSIFPRDSRG